MRHLRFSIASLLLVVLFVALAFAALRQADDLWDSVVFSLTLGLLLASVLLAIHRAEGRRAYWLGFALFGGAYLGASLIPPVEARLLTTRGLAYLYEWRTSRVNAWDDDMILMEVRSFDVPTLEPVVPDIPNPPKRWDVTVLSPPATSPSLNMGRRPVAFPAGAPENLVRLGHSLLAMILAFLGGHLSRSLHARGHRDVEG